MNENIETTSQKEEVESSILKEPRDWKNATLSKPDPDMDVVFRLAKPNFSLEDETKIYPIEDIVVGQWKEDHWEINPPLHKYNFNILYSSNRINDGTIVTHWAKCEEGEIEGWKSRLDYFNTYKNLFITVDQDKEEDIHFALMLGASFIEDVFNQATDPERKNQLVRYYQTLKDLEYSIDNGGIHESATSDIESE